MAIGPVENLFLSLLGLLWGSITVAIPLFVLVVIGKILREKIAEKTQRSWLVTAFISTFLLTFVLFLAAYFFPFLLSSQAEAVGELPSIFAPSATDILISYIYGILKAAITALVVSLLLMPLEFVGAYVHSVVCEKTAPKKKNAGILQLALTSYAMAVFSSAMLIFIVPEAIPGIFFFLYYGL
ncbi:MAG: hypothetical protein NUV67_02000 [archaeon]|nr:hypothetical protein [archaeon]